MNIFFTGSIRGGRSLQPEYAAIVHTLEKYGTVLSQHVADEALSHYGETHLSNESILKRELEALDKSDIVVAEVTTPAHGVGYLIGRATALGKRVIALHHGEYELKLTSIFQGDPHIEIHAYKDTETIDVILAEALH